jgi:Domain of Unknown Function (DUF748)
VSSRRRWVLGTLLVLVVILLIAGTLAVVTLPGILRQVAIWRLEVLTNRPVTIEALDLSLRSGRFSVRGFRVNDRDGGLLARFDSLEGRFHRRSLWQGHLWIEDLVLTNGNVRIVRTGPDRFNISDLLERPRQPSGGFQVTVDHFAIRSGWVALEDRVLSPVRTWRSDDIRLDARDITTTARKGTAVGSTTVAGALVTLRVSDLQLVPVHLHADVNIRDLDLTLADLYLPPAAVAQVESGVAHTAIAIDLDAKEGLRLDAEGVVQKVAIGRPEVTGDEVTSPEIRFLVRELRQRPGSIALRYASLEGDVTVLDPTTSPPTPLTFKDVTATASDLDPARGARLAIHGTLPGVGEVDIGGTAGVNPRRADVRVRARSVDLAFLGRYLPFEARVAGVGTADVRVVASDDKALAVSVTGDTVLEKVTVSDGGRTPVSAKRVAVRGLAYTYPATVRVADLTVTEPSTLVERNADGTLNLAALARRRPAPAGTRTPASTPGASGHGSTATPAVDVTVTRLNVIDGRASVSDAVSGGRVEAADIDVTAEDFTWPSRGPARVRVSTDVAGGRVSARGTVDAGPQRADLTVTARKVDLATVQPWLPPAAGRMRGAADADVTLALALAPLSIEAKGTVAGGNLAWTDGVHPQVSVARLDVSAEDFTWPSRGPARVRVSGTVAGGQVSARGTVDAGARNATLTVKASAVDLATIQPWLPIVGQIRGAADGDVVVTVGLDPFRLELKGALGAGNLAFLEGSKPLLTVKRVDATGIDLAWPTRLAIDRLRVNAPWAEVARNTQGELSLRSLFRRRADRPAPPPPSPDIAAAATPNAPPPTAGPVPGLQVSLRDALFENGGARIIDDAVEPAARFELNGSRLELRNLTWPARGAAVVQASTPMPGGGTLKARGTFSIEPTKLALDAELDQVDLAPGRPYLPFDARINGKVSGRAKINGTFGDTIALVIDGDATVERLGLGDLDRRLATVQKAELTGFRYSYPTSVRIRELTLQKPWMLVERNSNGSLELVSLFKARRAVAASGTPVTPASTPAKPAEPARVRVAINKLRMTEGFIRFVDRTTSPAYAEELSGITLVGDNLGTPPTRPGAAPRRGTVELRGTLASGTPVAVKGQVGSYPGPLFLDVTVDITDFPVPRLNPYLDRLSSWIARQGTLTAGLSFKVNGDELDAMNQVQIDGLKLEPGGHGGEFRRRTGLPLDTLVSLLKDRKGVIKLTIPVSGRLSAPDFQYGEAVWAAMRNLAIKLVALPFSLVGKLFFTEDSRIESVQIDPVTFQTATAKPDKDGAEQIERLATFLKETPEIRLRLRPVTTVGDVTRLRREALDSKLATLGADEAARRQAAVGLYTELFPRREPPTSDEVLYDELTRETPTPPRALRALATDRVTALRDALIRAGVPGERLEPMESRAAVESEGAARVEFEIRQTAE